MWTLTNVSKEQFSTIYSDKVDSSIFERQPKDVEDYVENFLSSKLWRLNNLHTIIDKAGREVRFNMNYAQHRVYSKSLEHPRLIILKSRQQGISTFWLISFIDDVLVHKNFTLGLMAQGTDEATTLLQKVKLDWEKLDPDIKSILNLKLLKDNMKEIKWSNGSLLFIRTSFRSTTLQRLHISELAKIAMKTPKRAEETKTGTLQAIAPKNTAIIESTAEGRTMFTDMWNKAVAAELAIKNGNMLHYTAKQFMPVFLPWFEDPDCNLELEQNLVPNTKQKEYLEIFEPPLTVSQKNFWLDQFDELGDTIYQEYPATPEEAFRKINNGSYFGALYHKLVVGRGRVVKGLYDSNLPVLVVLDLGMDDFFVLTYAQVYKKEIRVIDEYYNSGEGIEFYVNKMRDTGYDIEKVICPHDINVTELIANKSRLARLHELGVLNTFVLKKLSISAGIEQVRSILKYMYFDTGTTYLQSCMVNYCKEWDDRYGVWKSDPAKSDYCHGADTIRYLASYVNTKLDKLETTQVYDGMSF